MSRPSPSAYASAKLCSEAAPPTPGAIIIPAFHEATSLGGVLQQVMAERLDAEVVVVDDGSTDTTSTVAASHGATVVPHLLNLGYAAAIQTGLLYALQRGHRYAITFDADGQHDAATLPALVRRAAADDRPDIVIGSRFVGNRRYTAPLGRRIGMQAFSLLTRPVGGRRIYDTTSGLKWISRVAMSMTANLAASDLHSELIIYCLLRGLNVVEVPVTMRPRVTGISMHGAMSALVYPLKTALAILILRAQAQREGRIVPT